MCCLFVECMYKSQESQDKPVQGIRLLRGG